MNEMIAFISEVGFPIIVTLILLYRVEVKLDKIVTTIEGLPDKLSVKLLP